MNNGKIERMPPPKVITIEWNELPTEVEKRLQYMGVDYLKKWVKENYELSGTYEDIHVDELLKFIDEP